jgi:hypothetical protein
MTGRRLDHVGAELKAGDACAGEGLDTRARDLPVHLAEVHDELEPTVREIRQMGSSSGSIIKYPETRAERRLQSPCSVQKSRSIRRVEEQEREVTRCGGNGDEISQVGKS